MSDRCRNHQGFSCPCMEEAGELDELVAAPEPSASVGMVPDVWITTPTNGPLIVGFAVDGATKVEVEGWKSVPFYSVEHDAKRDKEVINKVAAWMTERGIGTGHGDTVDELLLELEADRKEVVGRALEAAADHMQGKCLMCGEGIDELRRMAAELGEEK